MCPTVLRQIQQVLVGDGKFILEFANKRHLKSMLRHLFGLNEWNPYTLDPVEFVELNFDFHPDYMRQQLTDRGFVIRRTVPVSWLRLGLLKRTLPTGLLASIDALLQRSGWPISPSIFLDLDLRGGDAPAVPQSDDPLDILRCPESGTRLQQEVDQLVSESGIRWGIRDGVYDFREPLN